MKKRVWDEIGCEFYDFDPNWAEDNDEEDDSVHLAELFCDDIDQIDIGLMNGGRHVFFEVTGADEAVAAFEEAFELIFQIHDVGLNHNDIAEIIPKCTADRLPYLRQRKEEFDEESEKASEEFDKEQQKELGRWQNNEWHDLEKLAQAARDAGWQEVTDHDFGQEQKRYSFYHDIGPNDQGNILRLELDVDDSRRLHHDLWLHESTSIIYKGGSTSCFGGWSMQPAQQYVEDIEFIDRWLGIPSPEQAVAALRHVLTWNDHMQISCEDYKLS